MKRRTCAVIAAAMTIGLAASACSSSDSGTKTTEATATTSAAATTTSQAAAPIEGKQLQSLVVTPADTQQTKGPDAIAESGIHLHFKVNGSPNDVMAAYKAALEGRGWAMTTIVTSGGGEGGGGATYTGTHGDAYGVFDGGGFASNTYIDVCAWPTKPADPNCSRGDR